MKKQPKNSHIHTLFVGLLLLTTLSLYAQETQPYKTKKISRLSFQLSGAIQSDFLLAEDDQEIQAYAGQNNLNSNSYLKLTLQNKYITSGMQVAYLKNPLPGFEPNFAGAGITNIYLQGRYKRLYVTVGDVYEQFGNGLILKTYEEKSLGIDNSLRGGRILLSPTDGIRIKVLGGQQRYYFEKRNNTVYGADVELNLNQWVTPLKKNNLRIALGSSFVTKTEPDEIIPTDTEHRLHLPYYVPATSLRATIQKGNFSIQSEYAHKWNDPTQDNNYIYKNGTAFFLSTTYSKRGMSILLQAKRNENMAYRSTRSRIGNGSFINYLPPFSMQHSYTLAAHYPYATQPLGEWGFQAEMRYNIKKKTALGGKYGMDIKTNFSHIRPLYDQTKERNNQRGDDGYKPRFFDIGSELYYQDINVEIAKKINRHISFTAMYMNQSYNQRVIEGHSINGNIIQSHIFVLDTKIRVRPNIIFRAEGQYLTTQQDQGDWIFALLESSLFSKLMISISNTYNAGNSKTHYPMITTSYNYRSHRIQIGYGRTRQGISCAGGVCRIVPASKGLHLSYNYIF